MGVGMLFAMSIPGLAVLLILLAAGERVVRFVRRRKGAPPRGPIDLDLGVVRLSPTTPRPSPRAG